MWLVQALQASWLAGGVAGNCVLISHVTFVVSYALGCADAKAFAAKLRTANEIEGYLPRGGGLYERAVVDVRLDDGEMVQAYVYHRPGCIST